jgi:hypothetical protein
MLDNGEDDGRVVLEAEWANKKTCLKVDDDDGDENGTGTDFFPSTSISLLIFIPPILHCVIYHAV